MNRRQLFGATVAAPALIAAAAHASASRNRISCETGDPGEVRYGELCAEGLSPIVTLDGREVSHCVMADPGLGIVKRARTTESGNTMFNRATGKILYEDLRGVVAWTTKPF